VLVRLVEPLCGFAISKDTTATAAMRESLTLHLDLRQPPGCSSLEHPGSLSKTRVVLPWTWTVVRPSHSS